MKAWSTEQPNKEQTMDKQLLTFSEAYQIFLSQGIPIKRVDWLGYWVLEDEELFMYCKNGDTVRLSEGCDPTLTLSNIAENDWMPVDDDLREELDTIRASRVLAQETTGA